MFSAIRARIRPESVSTRLTLWYLLTLGASLAVFAALVYVVRARTAYDELDAQLDLQAHQIVAGYRSAFLSLDVAGEIERDRRAVAIPFVVREVPGRLIFRSPAFPPFDGVGDGRVAAAARSVAHFLTATDREGVPRRIVTLIVERPGAEALAIQVAASMADVATGLRQLGGGMALAIALVLADAGYLMTTPDAVDVAAVAADCCEIARVVAAERQITIELQILERPTIQGSALHLRRVFLNLVENAIRYSPPGGTVQVRVAREGDRVVATIEDQGCGIDPVDLPHVFEPFYRADPARARETGGTGLGLAIADQVVRAHGGRIDVSSQPGAGSTFRILLPSTRESPPAPALD